MANIKSAMKRIKVAEKKNLRNRMVISSVKTAVKKVNKAVLDGDAAVIDSAYRNAVSLVDKAAVKGIIHKNAASRKKAQLSKLVAAK